MVQLSANATSERSDRLQKLADAVGVPSAQPLPSPTSWFIAVVTPNTEKSCKQKLEALLAELHQDTPPSVDADARPQAYVPIQQEVRIWPSTGKRKKVDKVLCPCYLFIRCSDAERYQIACKAKFILHFVMDRARTNDYGRSDFARIPHIQMEHFMRMVGDAETPITIDPSQLQVGRKVRIKTGRMAGLEGNIYRKPNGATTIALRVNMLGYAIMECPLELLELVEEQA